MHHQFNKQITSFIVFMFNAKHEIPAYAGINLAK